MKYKVTNYPTGDGEIFAHDAFEKSIGKDINVTAGDEKTTGKLLAAEVSPDGTYSVITIEIPDDSAIANMLRNIHRP